MILVLVVLQQQEKVSLWNKQMNAIWNILKSFSGSFHLGIFPSDFIKIILKIYSNCILKWFANCNLQLVCDFQFVSIQEKTVGERSVSSGEKEKWNGKTQGKMNNHSLVISMMRNSSSHTNSSVLAINTSFLPHTETKSTEKLLNDEKA